MSAGLTEFALTLPSRSTSAMPKRDSEQLIVSLIIDARREQTGLPRTKIVTGVLPAQYTHAQSRQLLAIRGL